MRTIKGYGRSKRKLKGSDVITYRSAVHLRCLAVAAGHRK